MYTDDNPASIYEKLEELQTLLQQENVNKDYIQGQIDTILWIINKYKISL